MTRKIQILGLAVVAVFAISVVVASAASAEVALWLAAGAEITASLASQATGLLELTDLGAPGGEVTVDCEGTLVGTLGANGVDTTTEILYLGKKETENLLECALVTGKAGLCETSMLTDVIPLSLPWSSQLELSGEGYVDVILPATAGDLGYMVTCLTILGETLDECKQASATQTVTNVTGGVNGASNESGTGNCTLGGNGEGDIVGSGLLVLTSGEALTVSMP